MPVAARAVSHEVTVSFARRGSRVPPALAVGRSPPRTELRARLGAGALPVFFRSVPHACPVRRPLLSHARRSRCRGDADGETRADWTYNRLAATCIARGLSGPQAPSSLGTFRPSRRQLPRAWTLPPRPRPPRSPPPAPVFHRLLERPRATRSPSFCRSLRRLPRQSVIGALPVRDRALTRSAPRPVAGASPFRDRCLARPGPRVLAGASPVRDRALHPSGAGPSAVPRWSVTGSCRSGAASLGGASPVRERGLAGRGPSPLAGPGPSPLAGASPIPCWSFRRSLAMGIRGSSRDVRRGLFPKLQGKIKG